MNRRQFNKMTMSAKFNKLYRMPAASNWTYFYKRFF